MRRRLALAAALATFLAAPAADAAYFGKNKVQYENFHWRVLETPHFEILFYDREAAVVQDAARLAERAYTQLSVLLAHQMARRVPLILYASHSDFQQSNITESLIDLGTGGVTELARRRVFLPFTGSYGELEHVLTHELVHAFELDILLDPAAADPLSVFSYAPPLWVMEGLAEYLSRGGSDTHTEMWLRDAALSGYLLPIEQLEAVRDIRVYRFGQSIWQFFAAQYGNDRIGDLLRAMRDRRSLDGGLRAVAGVSLREFSERWSMSVRRRDLPSLARRQTADEFARPVVTRRTTGASMLLAPVVSPDGEHLVYVSDERLSRDLYVSDIGKDEGRGRCLVEGESSGDFEALRFFSAGSAWSPDGRTVAFAAKTGAGDALYLLDVRSRRILAKLGFGLDEVQTPTFSPDGEEIIFVGLAAGQSDLYRVRRDGTGLERLTHDRFAALDPQWSPDGRSIVYVTDEGPETDFDNLRYGRLHLELLDLASGMRRDITPFAKGKAVSPAWSANGEYVAFVSDCDGTSNIYVLHLPTGQVFRLTDSVTGISGILPSSPALSWARNSQRLVFSVFSDAGWEIYRIDDPIAAMRPLDLEPGEIAAMIAPAAATVELAAALGDAPGTTTAADVPSPDSPLSTSTLAASTTAADSPPGFRVRDYKVRLSPDLTNVGGVVGFEAGFGGQSQINFSDLLGNHNLGLGVGIYGSLKDSDLYVSYLNRTRRTNYALSAFQFKKRYGVVGSRESADLENQTYRGVRLAMLRPFDKFARFEASLQVAGVGGRFYLGQTADETAANPQAEAVKSFVGPGLAYVQDTAVFGSTGPIKGRRIRLSFEGAVGQIDYATVEVDLRRYWNLYRRYALATRLYAGTSHGNTPQTIYLGGAQSLRGYDYGDLVGNSALLGSLEFRFPLVRHLALGWPLPLEFGNVQGVLFADAASAWDDVSFRTSRAVRGGTAGRAPQASCGFGVRLGLGYMVLKLDWARRYDSGTGRLGSGSNISLGADF